MRVRIEVGDKAVARRISTGLREECAVVKILFSGKYVVRFGDGRLGTRTEHELTPAGEPTEDQT